MLPPLYIKKLPFPIIYTKKNNFSDVILVPGSLPLLPVIPEELVDVSHLAGELTGFVILRPFQVVEQPRYRVADLLIIRPLNVRTVVKNRVSSATAACCAARVPASAVYSPSAEIPSIRS